MKKYIYYSIFIALSFIANSCDLLDKNPLDSPNQETFWNNASEIGGGVVACYGFLIEYPNTQYIFPVSPDLMTDIGFPRQESDSKKIAQGQHDSNLNMIYMIWSYAYQGIGRCNLMLQTIENKSSLLTQDEYNQYKGECRFLRAFYYSRLISYFGDVPLVLKPIVTVSDANKYVRESKAVVLDSILSDFTIAANLLKTSYTDATDIGRATKGAANAYKARIALYNGKWNVAIEAAQDVISSGVYDVYPKYGNLFLASGLTDATNKEIILKAEFSSTISLFHQLPLYMQSRNMGAYSAIVPTQNLIDSYDCIDGKNISESPLFNKSKPFENRDPRLRLGFVVPGDRYGDFQFESQIDSSTCWNYALNKRVTNMDCYSYSPYTSYTGYISRKYSDPAYAGTLNQKADYPLILCRYAEVLLIYAEAKIEANDIDETVVTALNKIRAGRDDVKMPVFTLSDLTDQAKARVIVRHERKVELAFEGFRYIDVRRWDGYWKYANIPVMGRPFKGSFATWPTVTFDENDEPVYDYNNYIPHPSTDYRVVENRVFIQNKHELWPIPQKAINVSPQLTQNPGF